jgi:molybdopterin/thiamine biosynthesis adenylyltransferase
MSISSIDELEQSTDSEPEVLIVSAPGFPAPRHPAEADCFSRHEGVPGHVQNALADARICIVGAGGLGSWTALSLARSGARSLTIVEPDRFERSNASRQLMFDDDVGTFKAFALAHNLVPHLIAGGEIIAIRTYFAAAVERYALAADIIVCLVDNNQCRLEVVRFAKARRIPAAFAMLSTDAMRLNAFLQEPDSACLWCALPNLAAVGAAPCAAASIISCFLAASYVAFFVHRALMGWPKDVTPFNWREADLLAEAPDRAGLILKCATCAVCAAKGQEW